MFAAIRKRVPSRGTVLKCLAFTLGIWFGQWAMKAALVSAAGNLSTTCSGDICYVWTCINSAGGFCAWPDPGASQCNCLNAFGLPIAGTNCCQWQSGVGVAYAPPVCLAGSTDTGGPPAVGSGWGATFCEGCRTSSGGCPSSSGGSCTGACQYISVIIDAAYVWQLQSSTCAGSGCSCSPPSYAASFDCNADNGPCAGTCGAAACTGSCTYTAVVPLGGVSPVWQLTSNTCAGGGTGCGCPATLGGACPTSAQAVAGATESVACGTAGGTCTQSCAGSCGYTAVSDGSGGYVWQLSTNTCTAGVSGCTCPSSPGGNCPSQSTSTTTASCGSSGGPCTPLACSGTCAYTSVGGSSPTGYVWQLSSNNCVHADNCTCPSSPAGALCPTSLSTTTNAACGSSSGPCQGSCSGTCTYTSVAGPTRGTFVWQVASNTCSGGSNCTCPACPSSSQPTALRQSATAACGSSSQACACANDCSSHGGDHDGDCCCADVDCNDYDPTVCTCDNCSGTCTRCWAVDPAQRVWQGLGNPVTWYNAGSSWLAGNPAPSGGSSTLSGANMIECDPDDPYGPYPCNCATIQNGDMDNDGCCDCQDDYPNDPRQGCPCCNFGKFWIRGEGGQFYQQWKRIFPWGGPAAQFLTWSPAVVSSGVVTPGYWTYSGPTMSSGSDPGVLALTMPLNSVTRGLLSDQPVTLPLGLVSAEAQLTSVTGVTCTGYLAQMDTYRLWIRTSLIFVVAVMFVGVVLQEVRV